MSDRRLCLSITSDAKLREFVHHISQTRRFAFDTEFVSESTFEPELGLIQVATTEKLAIIDPLAVSDLGPFWEVLNDPKVVPVMHAAGEDLWISRQHSGQLPTRLLDVQVAAGFIGFGYPSSLTALVQGCLDIPLNNSETRTDWLRRPLSPAQVQYALDDVRHLLDLAQHIETRLAELGRSAWAEEEYQVLLRSIERRGDSDRWRRLPGLSSLNRRSLEIARRLWEWRQEQARLANRPVRHILRDDVIVTIAKKQPATPHDLEQLRDFPRNFNKEKTHSLLARVREAKALPEQELPEPPDRPEDSRGTGMIANLLAAVLNRACYEHKLAPGLMGTMSDLKEMVRWVRNGQIHPPPALAQGWRYQACGKLLIDVLCGRGAIRVHDLDSDMPLVIDAMQPDPHPQAARD